MDDLTELLTQLNEAFTKQKKDILHQSLTNDGLKKTIERLQKEVTESKNQVKALEEKLKEFRELVKKI